MKISILLLLLVFSSQGYANELINSLHWQFKKEQNNIKVFGASVPNSNYKAVLAETVVDSDVTTIINLLRSPEKCSEWVYRCKSSVLHSQKNLNTDVVYTTSKMPFIIENRDILAEITWHEDPVTHIVKGVGKAINGVPERNNYIRIKDAQMVWELVPLTNGKTEVRSYAHVNPAGGVPPWIINMLSINIPINTLSELKKLLAENA